MELRHICGNTYAAVGTGAIMGVYRLNERDIVLLDTGVRQKDRADLDAMISENHFFVKGIFCSHAHYDHSGSTQYLRDKWNVPVAAQIIEAGIGATPESYHGNYTYATYEQCRQFFAEEWFTTDVVIGRDAKSVSFCGAEFGILQLPGHTAGQIGIVTPDNVAYLADCLIGPAAQAAAKLPTSMCIRDDLNSKASLHNLDCKAYILAHHDILTDIHAITNSNIEMFHQKIREILDCLTDGMTGDQWRSAFSEALGLRTHNPFKLSVIRRNFASFLLYLEDIGAIGVQWDNCTKHYVRL